MKQFTPQEMQQLQYRYLQHTGSIKEESQQINFEGQITKRNELKLKTGTLVLEWINKCVKREI